MSLYSTMIMLASKTENPQIEIKKVMDLWNEMYAYAMGWNKN